MTDDRRPAFARDFPREPALDELVDAFAHGNYARVRAEAPRLASSDDPAVRDAAKTLADRTRPDPLAAGLLAVTAALLVIVTAYWVVHGRAPAHQAVPQAPIQHVR
jgi:hypothetical protein